MDVALPELHCHRCVYTWTPRRPRVQMCPRCKSKLWNVPVIRPVRLGSGQGIAEVLGPHRTAILRLLRKHGARRIRVFGSVRRREAGPNSDVDLLVDTLGSTSLLEGAHLRVELREILGRRVDVVEEDLLPWVMRPQVLAEAVAL